MNYQHFSIEERCCLRKYYKEGLSYRKIAKLLGRSPSTISREIARNQIFAKGEVTYYPHRAQKKYRWRRSFCHRGLFRQDKELMDYIDEKLSLTWSPEEISHSNFGKKMPSYKTIYRWIYEGYLKSGINRLRRKGKSSGEWTQFKNESGKSIRKRNKDTDILLRKTFGHWEADTVVGGTGKGKECFAVFEERMTRYYIVTKIKDRTANSMTEAAIRVFGKLPSGAVKSITCDRGPEFAGWRKIEEALSCDVYFTDPYRAWQKGSIENSNGLLREFYPKGRGLSKVNPHTLQRNVDLINNRPKKILNFLSPQLLFENMLHFI